MSKNDPPATKKLSPQDPTTTVPPAGGLFSGSATTNPGGGLFGNTTTNTGGGLFGNNTTNTGGCLFGGGGLFGTKATIPTATNSNGQEMKCEIKSVDKTRACIMNGVFYPGYTATDIANHINNARNILGFQAALPEALRRLVGLYFAYNPCTERCRFLAFFYDKIAFDKASASARTPLAMAKELCGPAVAPDAWQRAVAENPAPAALVPVVYRGTRAVAYRAYEINEKFKVLRKAFDDYSKTLEGARAAAAALTERLAAARRTQEALALRLMRSATASLTPSFAGNANAADEEELLSKVEMLKSRVSGALSMREKVQELGFKKDSIRMYAALADGRKRSLELPQETLDALTKHLAQQQKSILRLAQVLDSNKKDVASLGKSSKKDIFE